MTDHEIDADSTAVVNSILLWRIYDCLLALLPGDISTRLAAMHEKGEFLGPNPAYRPEPVEQFIQPVGVQEEPGK